MIIPKEVVLSNPVLLDRVVGVINGRLGELKWLPTRYGIATTKYRDEGGKKSEPAVYTGKDEYASLLPSDDMGNFSFWCQDGADKIGSQGRNSLNSTTNLSLIVFFKYPDVFSGGNSDSFSVENVKNDVLSKLVSFTGSKMSVTVLSCHTDVYEVYKGYSVDVIKRQFAMRPFGCLRVRLSVFYSHKICI